MSWLKQKLNEFSEKLCAGLDNCSQYYDAITKKFITVLSWFTGVGFFAVLILMILQIQGNPTAWAAYFNASMPSKLLNLSLYFCAFLILEGGSRGHTIRSIMENADKQNAVWQDRAVAAGLIGLFMIGVAWVISAT
jgi:hypothetical protein